MIEPEKFIFCLYLVYEKSRVEFYNNSMGSFPKSIKEMERIWCEIKKESNNDYEL